MRKLLFSFLVVAACGGSSSAIGSADDGGGGGSGTGEASNPPGCPKSPPAAGGTCTIEGAQCNYGCSAGGQKTFAHCITGRWDVSFAGGDACKPPDPPPGTPFACGKTTCSGTEYCIHPCCGGPGPTCDDLPEGGTCPPGSTKGTCPSTGRDGCFNSVQCTPDPPYCVSDPKTVQFCNPNPDGSRNVSCVCA